MIYSSQKGLYVEFTFGQSHYPIRLPVVRRVG
jgi:hypothetical protein